MRNFHSKFISVILVSTLLSSCASTVDQIEMAYDQYSAAVSRYIASTTPDYNPSKFKISKEVIYELQEAVEKNLVWRMDFAKAQKKNTQSSLKFISPYFDSNQKITSELNTFLKNISWVTDPTTRFEIRTNQTTLVEQRREIYFEGKRKLKRQERDIDYAIINPYDIKGAEIIKAIKIGFIANIAIYENHLLLKNKIREAIKSEKDITLQKELENYHNNLVNKLVKSPSHRRLAKMAAIYRDIKIFEEVKNKTRISYYINPLIEETLVYNELIKSYNKKKRWNEITSSLQNTISSMALKDKTYYVGYFNKAIKFENLTGGQVTYLGKTEKDHLVYQLKPMDIIFTHNKNSFNNAVVDRFWDNVGIWIGSWDEIVKLGLSKHPLIIKYRNEIQSKNLNFITTTREGIKLKSIESIYNQDDLAVIRKRKLSYHETTQGIVLALSNIGKPYDYKMDPSDTSRISFAQLVFESFPQIKWDKSHMYKQEAVAPYKITQRTGEQQDFFTVLLYHDGNEVMEDLEDNFRKLSSLQ
ncbi:YiiX/YebB-like N1pC/P60 family cysteine hydrolase [Halobacteriovorax sp. RT-1-4]|uniref:YiiX/YebB-like N1pC/P60 family cysteine hydrolase n=1 Tax=unclassified Halobacteriovorax TaxID=2639665 RepID=UPI00399AC5D1